MQKIKTAVRFSALCLAVLCAVIFAAVAAAYRETSPEYNVVNGKKLAIECDIPLVVRDIGGEYTTDAPPLTSFDVRLDLLGIIPLRKAKVNVVSENTVCVLGMPFGMKIYTDGVLVVNISEVDTASGNVSPAKKAGLKIDDSIITIDGQKVYTNSDVAEIIEQSGGKTLEIVIKRDNCLKRIELRPELSKSSRTYKAGIWVRDSSAGVGTLTFYLPANNTLCGLGHSVNDNDTGKILKISSGEIVKAEIISVTKAEKGKAGELRGRLLGEKYAAMNKNCECGVYGEAEKEMSLGENMSIAPKQEVRDGQALIYTCIGGTTVQKFTCEIKVNRSNPSRADLSVKITDKALLEKTGGIVQGMSGSPIVQNGKLVGAVTHVLVDDPTTGYGVFAETMLQTAQSVANENKLKDAS